MILDSIDDTLGLEEEESEKCSMLMGELMTDLHRKEGQLFQKAKIKWIEEGDANTGFFHRMINSRININEIKGLYDNNKWIDSVQGVKNVVFNYYRSHFDANQMRRPKLVSVMFRKKLRSLRTTC